MGRTLVHETVGFRRILDWKTVRDELGYGESFEETAGRPEPSLLAPPRAQVRSQVAHLARNDAEPVPMEMGP